MDYLVVVEGMMANGADAAMMTDAVGYYAALSGFAFSAPVTAYVWCRRHGWVVSDESQTCRRCIDEAYAAEEAEFEKWAEEQLNAPDDGSRSMPPQINELEGWPV